MQDSVRVSLRERMQSAHAECEGRRDAERAQSRALDGAAREKNVDRYRTLFNALAADVAAEICARIGNGKSRIELGTWDKPYASMLRRQKEKFIPPFEKTPSCLLSVFTQAAEAGEIDACAEALQGFFADEGVAVTLERKNLYTRQEKAAHPQPWWPRSEQFTLTWQRPTE